MFSRLLKLFLMTLLASVSLFAQAAWLDRPLTRNWNTGSGVVPNAPRVLVPIDTRCREQIRNPESLSDRAVTRAGWSLFGPAYVFGPVTVVTGMASVDGMCRPNQYNAFVFVSNRFAGTLAPEPVSSRTDGSFGRLMLNSPTEITAEFARYTSNDPLCCPSQTSTVRYTVGTGARGVVRAENVDTGEACKQDGGVQTQDNVVSGTVTYRQRSALPTGAVLVVRLLNVSRQDVTGEIIAEQRIEAEGRQVPISFDLAYEQNRIRERDRYVIQAQILDGERLLFTTETSYPVITQGNPRTVDITVVPVGRGPGQGQGSGTIRGSVTYLQRIALARNSTVTVKLVDSATPEGTPVAETTVETNGRQVPIQFELTYEPRDINRQRNYELQAEIRSDGRLTFRTESGQPVTLRGPQPANVTLTLVPASDEPDAITGQTLNLAKFGTGTMQIAGRTSWFLIRATVNVQSSGDATVTLSRLDGSVTFTGKLTAFDPNVLRITVQSSGEADASGEIEVRYAGTRLNSITGNNLVLDGQNVTLRF